VVVVVARWFPMVLNPLLALAPRMQAIIGSTSRHWGPWSAFQCETAERRAWEVFLVDEPMTTGSEIGCRR
jgi:hypothetical protein